MSDLGELLVCARRVVHLRPSFVVPVSVRVRRPFKGVFPFLEVARWGLKRSLERRDRTTFHTRALFTSDVNSVGKGLTGLRGQLPRRVRLRVRNPNFSLGMPGTGPARTPRLAEAPLGELL